MIGRLIDLSIDHPLTVEEIKRYRPSRLVLWAAGIVDNIDDENNMWLQMAPMFLFFVYLTFCVTTARGLIPFNLPNLGWLGSPASILFFFICVCLWYALILGSFFAVRFWFRSGSIQSIALTVEDSTIPAQRQWLPALYLDDAPADMHRETRRLCAGSDARKYVKSVQMQGRVLTVLESMWLFEGREAGRWQRVRPLRRESANRSTKKVA